MKEVRSNAWGWQRCREIQNIHIEWKDSILRQICCSKGASKQMDRKTFDRVRLKRKVERIEQTGANRDRFIARWYGTRASMKTMHLHDFSVDSQTGGYLKILEDIAAVLCVIICSMIIRPIQKGEKYVGG